MKAIRLHTNAAVANMAAAWVITKLEKPRLNRLGRGHTLDWEARVVEYWSTWCSGQQILPCFADLWKQLCDLRLLWGKSY